MTYYDHATAMAFKLNQWQDEPILRNHELEVLAATQRNLRDVKKRRSKLKRYLSAILRVAKS